MSSRILTAFQIQILVRQHCMKYCLRARRCLGFIWLPATSGGYTFSAGMWKSNHVFYFFIYKATLQASNMQTFKTFSKPFERQIKIIFQRPTMLYMPLKLFSFHFRFFGAGPPFVSQDRLWNHKRSVPASKCWGDKHVPPNPAPIPF